MFALQTFTTILAFLSFSVQASPLAQRDVIAPQIIEPDATSIWPVGTQQVVIWNTSNFPAQITNPIGQIILGFNESNSLNLDFNNPLAKGFQLTDGNVTIIVPDVAPRDDYLIVLFGDSGDTSPAFAITRICSGSTNFSSPASSGSNPDSSTPPAATSLSISGSVTTAAFTEGTPTSATSLPTGTTPTGSTGSSSTISNSPSGVTSALAASTPTSAGWSLHRSSIRSSAAHFLVGMVPLVILLMV